MKFEYDIYSVYVVMAIRNGARTPEEIQVELDKKFANSSMPGRLGMDYIMKTIGTLYIKGVISVEVATM
jgi:hypothetical protein